MAGGSPLLTQERICCSERPVLAGEGLEEAVPGMAWSGWVCGSGPRLWRACLCDWILMEQPVVLGPLPLGQVCDGCVLILSFIRCEFNGPLLLSHINWRDQRCDLVLSEFVPRD